MSKKNLPVSQKLSENCPKTILKIVQSNRLKDSDRHIFGQKLATLATRT